jgi:arginyl-tRNA synthetase
VSISPQNVVAEALAEAISVALKNGELTSDIAKTFADKTLAIENIPLERPKNREHGDYASSIALALAKNEGKAPRDIATLIQSKLLSNNAIAKIEVAGPGFINITLDKSSQGSIVNRILKERENFGKSNSFAGISINLEFISANPTGPLHLGHTRWAAVGDALARVLSAAGARVVREFYINDRGNQMDLFGASIRASVLGIPRPEDGYQGDYIEELGKLIDAQRPD